ncbi:hypothetical protein MetMK1DRAFT_00012160 [Metallosphaera yellowstonensis MK1]|jgi:hypothetical protein|uniref:Uncharacterized protein n=1 Tax=Metallosphaera yellowstonensis MK1 TaxID=671065 RepID=H2C392_9CREN|nr:hypothetical protein [Metallosphaera yellowstonensis]EHP70713.1 hypothetical protein MetMK1DRAFT_00012160 [Metallosphaera yellowstonensis MK1]
MASHLMWALPKRVGVIRDVNPLPLGSKESRDPPTLKSGRWLEG